MFGWFLNRSAMLQAVAYPLDPAGGPVPDPSTTTVLCPCAVQTDTPPERVEGATVSYRKGTKTRVSVFFGPGYSATPDRATAAVLALKLDDRILLDDGRTITLEGPAYDEAGRGAFYRAACRYTS